MCSRKALRVGFLGVCTEPPSDEPCQRGDKYFVRITTHLISLSHVDLHLWLSLFLFPPVPLHRPNRDTDRKGPTWHDAFLHRHENSFRSRDVVAVDCTEVDCQMNESNGQSVWLTGANNRHHRGPMIVIWEAARAKVHYSPPHRDAASNFMVKNSFSVLRLHTTFQQLG